MSAASIVNLTNVVELVPIEEGTVIYLADGRTLITNKNIHSSKAHYNTIFLRFEESEIISRHWGDQ